MIDVFWNNINCYIVYIDSCRFESGIDGQGFVRGFELVGIVRRY